MFTLTNLISFVRGTDSYSEYSGTLDDEGDTIILGERWKLGDIYHSRSVAVGAPNDITSEYNIVYSSKNNSISLLLVKKSTNKVVDFFSLRTPIDRKSIDVVWYNHNVYFKDIDPTQYELKHYDKIVKEQKRLSKSMMEFIIHHNDLMRDLYHNSLMYLTLLN